MQDADQIGDTLTRLHFLKRWLMPERHVRRLFEDQVHADFTPLLSSPFLPPELELQLVCVRDAYICFGQGLDGVVFDRTGRALRTTTSFASAPALPDAEWVQANAIALDVPGFTSVDPAWGNYYHWLCFAIARMRIAQEFLSSDVRMLLPDFRDPNAAAISPAGQAVRIASLKMMELDGRVEFLRPGVYRLPEIHLLQISHDQQALMTCFEHFRNAFTPALRALSHDERSPRRIFIKRRNDTRMGSVNPGVIEGVLRDCGFHAVDLEDLTFFEQANLFHNAELVVAAHGAGLSNLVFGRPQLRILELNDRLAGEGYLRPWFYYISRVFGYDYSYVDLSNEQSETARWKDLIENFLAD